MFNTATDDGPAPLSLLDRPAVVARSMPGGYGRGPMNQLVRMYRMLVRGGELDGTRVLSPQTVAGVSARHRTGVHDRTLGVVMDWGLGFNVDGGAMGRHCSPRAFALYEDIGVHWAGPEGRDKPLPGAGMASA